MPIFEYRCSDCGHLTSVFSKSRDAWGERVSCARCGETKTRRVLSSFSFNMKGGGFDRGAGGESRADYSDPGQIGRWTERKFGELGLDLPGDTRKMIDAAREGELPAPLNDL